MDEKTFERVREFALSALASVEANRPLSYGKRFDFREAIKGGFSIFWGARLMTGTHRIDRAACVQCGTCTEKCPTGAIRYSDYSVDSGKCIYCYGCVNNCPAAAIDMPAPRSRTRPTAPCWPRAPSSPRTWPPG